ncbi:hypothetical protein FisN_8Lh244 [Fistulifera solaris]|uniref:Fungal lipase-type domain-containing protein n=1 Tax=Fistulifera solaris TaxID=1519565 RepID=A0A1Z5JNI8_FISSO|nr:hypothetical protein FisN_8Lh244 [Fistulifera solaris]|eukprot:GAX15456.1 hypothetical protein FisN_8Lh244 [Fistulifera solaris]
MVKSKSGSTQHNRNHSLINFDPFSPTLPDSKPSPTPRLTNHHGVPNMPNDDRTDATHERVADSPSGKDFDRYPLFSFSGSNNEVKQTLPNLASWKKTRDTEHRVVDNASPISVDGRGSMDIVKFFQHRKTRSLIENKRLWKEVKEAIPVDVSIITNSGINDEPSKQCSFLEKDSKKVDSINTLFLPSLTKPRPTSLLKTEDDDVRTGEVDPSSFQLTLPPQEDVLAAARTVSFLSTYRSYELAMDLSTLQGYSKRELQSFATGDRESCKSLLNCHRAVVEMLLDACPDLLEVKGYFGLEGGEVLIIERQKNQFLVAFYRIEPTTRLKKQPFALADHHKVTIAKAYFELAQPLTSKLFRRLDELSEESPFSDFVFAGHGTGAGLALLVSYLYSHTRMSQRVSAYLTGAPRIGLQDFRMAVHSQPNFQVIRMENQGQRGSQGFCHVGHCISLRQGTDKQWNANAFQFASETVSPGFRTLRFHKHSTAEEYVDALENTKKWPEDFHAEDTGEGVKGENNEKRILT